MAEQGILELDHVTRDFDGGGMVLVLNTGAAVTPEAEAMLQALHSRSIGGIRAHLKKLAKKGAAEFMESYYVGYGHKSIGDCGTVTLFIEGVSMLVAKAIQDWLLYSGQEASTRYIDFATQRFVDPVASIGSHDLLERWREFYLDAQEPLRAYLRESFPMTEEDQKDEKAKGIYDKAINARSFDILRGFLPAGASTNLAWHTNLRQAADHIALLRHHPLEEVRRVAEAMEDGLRQAYPSSFNSKRREESETYYRFWMLLGYHFRGPSGRLSRHPTIATERTVTITRDGVDREALEKEYRHYLKNRPGRTELPKQIAECGTMQFEFLLDFGSFRDIQRHRSVIQRMPLLTTHFGFHPWYLESLPATLRDGAEALLRVQFGALEALPSDEFSRQYYLPMGLCVPCRLTGDLAALTYVVERRAQTDVHPTLHEVALAMGRELGERFGKYGLQLAMDEREGRFDTKRGKQDIVEKE